MEILYEYTQLSKLGEFLISFLILAFIGGAAYIVYKLVNKRYIAAFIMTVIFTGILIISIIVVKNICAEHILKVKLNNTVSWNELSEKYYFIGNEGNIIILQDKEYKYEP